MAPGKHPSHVWRRKARGIAAAGILALASAVLAPSWAGCEPHPDPLEIRDGAVEVFESLARTTLWALWPIDLAALEGGAALDALAGGGAAPACQESPLEPAEPATEISRQDTAVWSRGQGTKASLGE